MKRFWISWTQYTDDFRPVTYPPSPEVVGWWNSGEDEQGNAILVALVESDSKENAKAIICSEKNWPEAGEIDEWRFFEEKKSNWIPGERFPIPAWSPLFLTRETR